MNMSTPSTTPMPDILPGQEVLDRIARYARMPDGDFVELLPYPVLRVLIRDLSELTERGCGIATVALMSTRSELVEDYGDNPVVVDDEADLVERARESLEIAWWLFVEAERRLDALAKHIRRNRPPLK